MSGAQPAHPHPGGPPHPGAQPPPYGGAPAPAPEPQRSWFRRHKILTAVLTLVGVVVLINLLGGGGGDDAGTATSATDGAAAAPADGDATADDAAADAAPAAQEQGPGIGDAVRDGKFEFTVTGVETGLTEVGGEWVKEEAQGQFVLVRVTVANIGDRSQMFDGSNQTLVDDQGREHSASTAAAVYLDGADSFLQNINPGNSVDGTIVFDIPADAAPTALELHDSMFSSGVTVTLTS